MLRRRFSRTSATAMLLAAALATFAMWVRQSDGFGGHRGFPFAWRWWGEVYTDRGVVAGYLWGRLAADLAIWGALTLAIGLYVERTRVRRLKRHESKKDAA
jgi:hypothetical protein